MTVKNNVRNGKDGRLSLKEEFKKDGKEAVKGKVKEVEYRTIEWGKDALYFSYEPNFLFLGIVFNSNKQPKLNVFLLPNTLRSVIITGLIHWNLNGGSSSLQPRLKV